ncbi:MAG: hypothetical protein GMKNLPBB_00680 [Myxococcota bacterium]|nr:hypothetical protein [Myxococcota bacterium]
MTAVQPIDLIHDMDNEPLRLSITFNGDDEALQAHRLSLSGFGEPLKLLLQAYRRIVSNFATQAIGDPERGKNGGRFAKEAACLDLQIEGMKDNCVTLQFAPALAPGLPPPPQPSLFDKDLLERGMVELVESVGDEQSGRPRNGLVRRYLQSLPKSVTAQVYQVKRGETVVAERKIGPILPVTPPPDLPDVDELEGVVAGVGFQPGPVEVRIKTANQIVNCAATEKQVDEALSLREHEVRALVVKSPKPRLLRLATLDDVQPDLSEEDILTSIVDKWDGLLKRLSK